MKVLKCTLLFGLAVTGFLALPISGFAQDNQTHAEEEKPMYTPHDDDVSTQSQINTAGGVSFGVYYGRPYYYGRYYRPYRYGYRSYYYGYPYRPYYYNYYNNPYQAQMYRYYGW